MNEFLTVSKRPKFRRFFTNKDVIDILETIDEYADFIEVKSKVDICRDPKDNFLLALAQDGNANLLLTGDKDLLALRKYGSTKILTITDYLR